LIKENILPLEKKKKQVVIIIIIIIIMFEIATIHVLARK
jgi:hypothetical protein